MRKFIAVICLVVLAQIAVSTASARVPDEVRQQFLTRFTPAVPHWALENGHESPNPDKLRGHVVVMKDGIPTGRAYWFMTMAEYEYRPVDIIDNDIKTYRGKPYAYLAPGQVMLISDVTFSKNMIYLKLLSNSILYPGDRTEKHPSRGSVMLGFKFPGGTLENADMNDIYKTVEQWIQPFQDETSARQFAAKTFGGGSSDVRVVTTPKKQSKALNDNGSLPVDLAVGDPHAGKTDKPVVSAVQQRPAVSNGSLPVDLAVGDPHANTTKAASKAAQTEYTDLSTSQPAKNTVASKKQTATISEGSSFSDVISTLGQPKSRIDLKDKTLLDYKDKTMVFRDGKLVDVNLK